MKKPFQEVFDHPRKTGIVRASTDQEEKVIKSLVHAYLAQHQPGLPKDRVPASVVQMCGSFFIMGVAYAGEELKGKR